MNSFSRAYRDPKSPLTPLTPLTEHTAFNFHLSGDTLQSFLNVIEAERTKETPKSSPAGLASGTKYVNANKYMKRQPANLNAHILSDTTNKSRKLSPRFISKKSDVDDKKILKESNNDLNNNKISSKYSSTSISSSSSRGSFKCNESSYKETDTIPSSKFKLSPSATSTFNYYSVSSSQSSAHSSSGSINSNNSSTTPNSFNYNGGARHHKPPKLVLNDANVTETDSTMSTVFNWVWNCLSPMKNPSIYELLARVDMQKYWEIFEKEEIIDLDVFSTLTMADLAAIGIKDTNDCVKILKSVGWALDFLSGLLNFKRPEK
ncbi:uncharacterized protein LOC105232017 [Bactrocera dorsalis]|uniref:Uncharacterized protein LOC105232017 n=1 Tax=Bactrocera dorsalis TaxID=27457 RepID=A0A6I9VFG1_BACDO|nr:uncharacterized protein LOC105232017 [Bactrocera dorsalis]